MNGCATVSRFGGSKTFPEHKALRSFVRQFCNINERRGKRLPTCWVSINMHPQCYKPSQDTYDTVGTFYPD